MDVAVKEGDIKDNVAPAAVTALAFADTDKDKGQVAGEITFTASAFSDVTSVKVFLGETEVPKVTDKYTIAGNTAAATKVKVVVSDAAGNTTVSTIDVVDVYLEDVLANVFTGLWTAAPSPATYQGQSVSLDFASNYTVNKFTEIKVSLYKGETLLVTNVAKAKALALTGNQLTSPFYTNNLDNKTAIDAEKATGYWEVGNYDGTVPTKIVFEAKDATGKAYIIKSTDVR